MDNQNVTQRSKKNKINDSLNLSFISTASDYLSKSFPDLSTGNAEIYCNEEIQKLNEQLQIAHSEIENLLLENNKLKQKSVEQNKIITQLKKLCYKSPYTPKSCHSLKKPRKIQQLNSSFENLQELYNNSITVGNATKDVIDQSPSIDNRTLLAIPQAMTQPTTKRKHFIKDYNNTDYMTSQKYIQEKDSTTLNLMCNRPEILIIGGQQISGLSSQLIRTRINSNYENYQISSVVKPNATSSELLKTCQNINDNSDNFILLCIGEDDKNPTKLMY
ncbi:hypothetical protein ACJJTC_017326, partial [Scirpophaga incertulas]